jgi:hypothetical protein
MNKQQSGEMLRRIAGFEDDLDVQKILDPLPEYKGKWRNACLTSFGVKYGHYLFDSREDAEIASREALDTPGFSGLVFSDGSQIDYCDIFFAMQIPVRS